MSGINKVILIGNLGKDPQLRHTPDGKQVVTFAIATSEKFNTKSGGTQEKTEWHNIVVWGKLAELCGKYLIKGRKVYIEGKLQSRQYNDKNGFNKTTTEIIANTVHFLNDGKIEADSKESQNDFFGDAPEF